MSYTQVIQLNMVNNDIKWIHDTFANIYNELTQLNSGHCDHDTEFNLFMKPIRDAMAVFKNTKASQESYRNIMYELYVALNKIDSESYAEMLDSIFGVTLEDKFYDCAIILNTAVFMSHKLKALYAFIYGCLRDYKLVGVESNISFSPIYSNEIDVTMLTGKVIKDEQPEVKYHCCSGDGESEDGSDCPCASDDESGS